MSEALSTFGLAPTAIERIAVDLVVAPLFEGERPLRGAAGRIDWRLCGRLSHLCAAGRLSGGLDSAVLILAGGGVRAPRVLGVGLGRREDLDAARWRNWVGAVLDRAAGLHARRLVVALPAGSDGVSDERLMTLATAVAAGTSEREVLVAPEPSDASLVVEWLRSASRRARLSGLEVRSPGETRAPHGAAAHSRASESSQASAGRFTR
jgi:hypothetical protein